MLISEDMSFYVSEKNSDYFLEYQVFIAVFKVRTLLLNNLPRNSFFHWLKTVIDKSATRKKGTNVITKLKVLFNKCMYVSINNQNFIEVYFFHFKQRQKLLLLLYYCLPYAG